MPGTFFSSSSTLFTEGPPDRPCTISHMPLTASTEKAALKFANVPDAIRA